MSTETKTAAGVVSTINADDRTTVIVTDPWTGSETLRLQTYVHVPEVGPPNVSITTTACQARVQSSVHLEDAEALRQHIRSLQYGLSVLEPAWAAWERRASEARGAETLAKLSPDQAESLAVAADMEREGRAA